MQYFSIYGDICTILFIFLVNFRLGSLASRTTNGTGRSAADNGMINLFIMLLVLRCTQIEFANIKLFFGCEHEKKMFSFLVGELFNIFFFLSFLHSSDQ